MVPSLAQDPLRPEQLPHIVVVVPLCDCRRQDNDEYDERKYGHPFKKALGTALAVLKVAWVEIHAAI
jgi:hypothetical protein